MKRFGFRILVFFIGLSLFSSLVNIPQAESFQSQEILYSFSSADTSSLPYMLKSFPEPHMAIDSKGNWHMAYIENTYSGLATGDIQTNELKYISATMQAPVLIATLTAPVESSYSYFYSPTIGIDNQDNIHIMYGQDEYLFADTKFSRVSSLKYVNNASGSWSLPQEVVRLVSSGDTALSPYTDKYFLDPHMAIDSEGNWHMAYIENTYSGLTTGDIETYELKYINNETPTPIVISTLTSSAESSYSYFYSPTIGIDNQDNIHIMYGKQEEISGPKYTTVSLVNYINNASGSWSLPKEVLRSVSAIDASSIPYSVKSFAEPHMSIDAKGNWHLAYIERTYNAISSGDANTDEIKYLNGKISTPFIFASLTSNLSDGYFNFYSPNVRIDNQGNIHIIYSEEDDIYVGTQYTVVSSIMHKQFKFSLDIFDGADFSWGREISSEPERLISIEGAPVEGAVADGVTRLLLKLDADELGEVTFSLTGTGNPKDDGLFCSIDGLQEGNSITVNTVNTGQGEQAFAIYRAPENFVREGYDEDKKTSDRTILIKVKSNSFSSLEFSKEIKLVRPPVILLHGLWQRPDKWENFSNKLKEKFPGIHIFAANYSETNAGTFEVNKDIVYDCINRARNKLRLEGIAMAQADIFGHCMGGLLARKYAGSKLDEYRRDDNFRMGDINKLITISSPHDGAFLAEVAMRYVNSLDKGYASGHEKQTLLTHFRESGYALDRGALNDLMTESRQIVSMNRTSVDIPIHAIIGDYSVPASDLDLIPGDLGKIHRFLNGRGFDTKAFILEGTSDLLASWESQAGGIDFPAISIFSYQHNDIIYGDNDVMDKAVELLNADADSYAFKPGFPVQILLENE